MDSDSQPLLALSVARVSIILHQIVLVFSLVALGYCMFITYKLEQKNLHLNKENEKVMRVIFMCVNGGGSFAIQEDGIPQAYFHCVPL